MNPARRAWLLALAGAGGAHGQAVQRGRALAFPRDHGAHLTARTEWWYATGWLGTAQAPSAGFQVTFFRSRTGVAEGTQSRFAARHVLFAHAAVTDLAAGQHRHAQRIARWSGDAAAAHARVDDARVQIGDWRLARDDANARWQADIPAGDWGLALSLQRTQPLLLQGDGGFSRKGPLETNASHYYSEPQLQATGRAGERGPTGSGRAWLDHEWSDDLLHPEAVGWDWIGMNLFDGSALTAFRLRRADGSALWAGGSWRPPGGAARAFGPQELQFTPGRPWLSPATGARYPMQWQVQTPAGVFEVRSLLDAQELDGRSGTGTVYWEGLSELLNPQGQRVGLGYLELTGYSSRLKL